MKNRVIEGSVNVFVTSYSTVGPNDLIKASDQELIERLQFTASDMKFSTDWMKVGTARIEVRLHSEADIVNGSIAALRAQQSMVRAEAEKRATDIERRIQTLLAITNEVPA